MDLYSVDDGVVHVVSEVGVYLWFVHDVHVFGIVWSYDVHCWDDGDEW